MALIYPVGGESIDTRRPWIVHFAVDSSRQSCGAAIYDAVTGGTLLFETQMDLAFEVVTGATDESNPYVSRRTVRIPADVIVTPGETYYLEPREGVGTATYIEGSRVAFVAKAADPLQPLVALDTWTELL